MKKFKKKGRILKKIDETLKNLRNKKKGYPVF